MTVPQHLLANADRLGEKRALLYKEGDTGKWRELSWRELARQVWALASHLISISVKKGDKVVLLAENRPEWVISDIAILAAGGVTVPLYFTSTASQIEHILNDSGAKTAIVSTVKQLDKFLKSKASQNVRQVILMDNPPSEICRQYDKVSLFSHICSSLKGSHEPDLEEGLAGQSGDDLASILYTSGTTGPPKGVMLTHNNFLFNANACAKVIDLSEDDLLLSFLPLSHAFERTAGCYLPLLKGSAIAYAESIDKIAENMLEIRPTIMIGVPRFYEKTYASIHEKVDEQSPLKKRIFAWGVNRGHEWARLRAKGERVPFSLRVKRLLADRLIFSVIRRGMGGSIRFFVSGGAPLSKGILDFFDAIGITILEGYGLTETSPVITCNTLNSRRAGTVGRALPGVDLKIGEDGEIATRGPHVMKGYYNNEAVTREVVRDGWFYTGDIGKLDDGYLTITDRKKDLIVTSGGKNVAPQTIETVLVADPFISQVMVYGDGKKFISALLVPDADKLKEQARIKKIDYRTMEELCSKDELNAFFMERIGAALTNFASFERVKKIVLVPEPFSMENGEITPTLKINRKKVTERFKELLESLYED